MEGGFLLDIVVTECATVFQLLTSEDQTLLIWWDSFFVLNLGLDIIDGVTGLNLKSDGLASQGLDKDLHTSTKSQDKMECGFLLDVVVTQCATVFQLLTSEDQTLLVWRNSLFILDLGFNVVDRIAWLNLEGDCLSCERFHENLHFGRVAKILLKIVIYILSVYSLVSSPC